MSQFVFSKMKEVVHEIDEAEELEKVENVEEKMDCMEIQEPFQLEPVVQAESIGTEIKDPHVVEESLEDFVRTIPSAFLDDYYNILNHDIIPEDMTNEEKRMAILHLSKECFHDGAVGFLKECQVAEFAEVSIFYTLFILILISFILYPSLISLHLFL